MNFTRVVNVHKDHCDAMVDRTSIFGNPFYKEGEESRINVIARYQAYFLKRIESDPEFRAAVEALKGKILGCHCVPKLCHGHIIAAWCNGELK